MAVVKECGEKLQQCLIQIDRIIHAYPDEEGQTVLRQLRQYQAMVHNREVKLVEHGGSRTRYVVSSVPITNTGDTNMPI